MLEFRILNSACYADSLNLQEVLEAAPAYSLLVRGRPPLPCDAQELFVELPPGKTEADKLVGGFWLDRQMVGCADICRDYPEAGIAYIGLLLFREAYQKRGYGSEALACIRSLGLSWQCHSLRVAVIENNLNALIFWKREGFKELARRPMPEYTAEAIVMQSRLKSLEQASPKD